MRLLVLSAFTLSCLAANAQPRLDIALRPVRWQPLPDQVEAVFVGPDQRVWYLLEHEPGTGPDLPQIKLRIDGKSWVEHDPNAGGGEAAPDGARQPDRSRRVEPRQRKPATGGDAVLPDDGWRHDI
jgi:hypothetical protein